MSVSAAAPSASRREQTKAANRTAILDAARRVFSELGYDAATVRDVIRRTDLASGTFYNYFPDKESVLRALMEESWREMRARVAEARANAQNLEEFVGDAYRAYFAFIVEDPPTFELTRRTDVVAQTKLQSLRLEQGPWQRRLRLASVSFDTAGRNVHAVAKHRDAVEAERLVYDGAERARQARAADIRAVG